MNNTPCRDWIPIEEVTPENCPDGSTVQIEFDVIGGIHRLLYRGIIHWDSDEHFTLEMIDATVKPCDK